MQRIIQINPMIDSYSFGKIVIDGREYTHNVIIYPDRIDSTWWRKEVHNLIKEDLLDVFEHAPDTLIVGTGADGKMRVPVETTDYIKTQGIELIVKATEDACNVYNDLMGKKKVVAALHLTC
jgi:hypothetical protein